MECLQHSLRINQKIHGADHSSIAAGFARIANLMVKQGNTNGAKANFSRLLDWYEKRPGEHASAYISTLSSVGRMYFHTENSGQAMEYFERAWDACRSAGCENQYIGSAVCACMAKTMQQQGKIEKAMEMYQEAMRINKSLHGDDHESIAKWIQQGRSRFGRKGRYCRCHNQFFGRSLDWYETRSGEHTLSLIDTLTNAGKMYEDLEDFDKAMEYFQRALEVCNDSGFQEQNISSIVHIYRGGTFRRQGKMKEAMEHYRQSMRTSKKTFSDD